MVHLCLIVVHEYALVHYIGATSPYTPEPVENLCITLTDSLVIKDSKYAYHYSLDRT
jgi:hypothetical protein